jgi:predicted nucleotidyltransferase
LYIIKEPKVIINEIDKKYKEPFYQIKIVNLNVDHNIVISQIINNSKLTYLSFLKRRMNLFELSNSYDFDEVISAYSKNKFITFLYVPELENVEFKLKKRSSKLYNLVINDT